MFVNMIPFLITFSQVVKFGTAEALPNRQISTVAAKFSSVLLLCSHQQFSVDVILSDNEFEPIQTSFPMLNICAADKHVLDIEQYIRTIKGSTQSTYGMLPFSHIS